MYEILKIVDNSISLVSLTFQSQSFYIYNYVNWNYNIYIFMIQNEQNWYYLQQQYPQQDDPYEFYKLHIQNDLANFYYKIQEKITSILQGYIYFIQCYIQYWLFFYYWFFFEQRFLYNQHIIDKFNNTQQIFQNSYKIQIKSDFISKLNQLFGLHLELWILLQFILYKNANNFNTFSQSRHKLFLFLHNILKIQQ
ncbi:unnamed protein product [Paramecium pentaurelia]|uniref:Transmembrane protein n=1 Tax=Paramecium pentaurelia TaxID=43138 RepID=A0A8S1V2G3_9CILI|nr:unnamed protein product [Paramecium pentaurelia]